MGFNLFDIDWFTLHIVIPLLVNRAWTICLVDALKKDGRFCAGSIRSIDVHTLDYYDEDLDSIPDLEDPLDYMPDW